MSRSYRRRPETKSTPRISEAKREKQRLQAEIDEEMKRIRSPLYKWEQERA